MKLFVIAVRDRVADVYGQPNFVANIGAAIRGFADEINRDAENNQFYKHPDDFDLFELGTYDDVSASFECLSVPRQLALGRDLKKA